MNDKTPFIVLKDRLQNERKSKKNKISSHLSDPISKETGKFLYL